MADEGLGNGGNMHSIVYPPPLETLQGQQQTAIVEEAFTSHSPTHVLSPASSLDSDESLLDPDDDPSLGVDLAPSQEDQIEKLKEFLSEAQVRGDDLVTQKDADTVKNLETMQIASSSSTADGSGGLGARLESAARANLEIEKQTASGYFPSETVYLEEQTLRDVLDDAGSHPILGVTITASVASRRSPQTTASTAVSPMKSPRSVDAENALKNELDCLFQERAGRFRLD